MVLLQEKTQLAANITQWMSWEAGVDLVAKTHPELEQPNIIVHVARMVHTPVGSAPAGMLLYQPDPTQAPEIFGFISTDKAVGEYFGPNIFAGTPFEAAPFIQTEIDITSIKGNVGSDSIAAVQAIIKFGETSIESYLELPTNYSYDCISRPASLLPFNEQALECAASSFKLTINGQAIQCTLPESSMNGGPAAAFSPSGFYSR